MVVTTSKVKMKVPISGEKSETMIVGVALVA